MRTILCTTLLATAFASSPIFYFAAAQATRTRSRPTAAVPAPKPAPVTPAATSIPCTCAQPVRHVQPYTARQETSRVQTLSDGTAIKTTAVVLLARDAEGRTRRETARSMNGETAHTIEIYDTVTQTRYIWTTGPNSQQVVTVYRPRPVPQVAQPAPPQPSRRYYPYRTESLPPQTIGDLYVEGTRTTRTTPAGYDGNDKDIVSTSENWFAPTLGLQMRMTSDDPRSGKSVTETTDVKQTDPAPTLFQTPAGYTLKDANP